MPTCAAIANNRLTFATVIIVIIVVTVSVWSASEVGLWRRTQVVANDHASMIATAYPRTTSAPVYAFGDCRGIPFWHGQPLNQVNPQFFQRPPRCSTNRCMKRICDRLPSFALPSAGATGQHGLHPPARRSSIGRAHSSRAWTNGSLMPTQPPRLVRLQADPYICCH